jgi:hypothetical protein
MQVVDAAPADLSARSGTEGFGKPLRYHSISVDLTCIQFTRGLCQAHAPQFVFHAVLRDVRLPSQQMPSGAVFQAAAIVWIVNWIIERPKRKKIENPVLLNASSSPLCDDKHLLRDFVHDLSFFASDTDYVTYRFFLKFDI